MDLWHKETLNLAVGDSIVWQDEAVEVEGQPAVVEPGIKGEVISMQQVLTLDVLARPIDLTKVEAS